MLSKSFLLWWINMDLCPLQKISQLTKQDGGETLGDVELIYPFLIITGGLYRALIFLKNDDSVSIIQVNWPCQRLWHRNVCGILVNQVVFLMVNHCGPSTDETIVCRDPWGSLVFSRPVSDYEWIHPFRGCRWHRHTCMWHLCEAGRFSYGESLRTPRLEGTSLHRWHNSVERPWGILSLFTTCFWLWVNSPFQSL